MNILSASFPDLRNVGFDRPLPTWLRLVLILLCGLIPTVYVAKQYENRHDLTQLILFGQKEHPHALPEIRALQPATDSPDGFDGQFYAQIALDPSVQRPEFRTSVLCGSYRAQRVFLPALAYVIGHGSPPAILRAYALLNLGFWYVLLAALLCWVRGITARGMLVIYAIVLSTGALISIQRALTDLPAATLGFLSIGLEDVPAALLISIAILTKPTTGLFLTRYLSPFPDSIGASVRRGGIILLALVLPALWNVYIYHVLGNSNSGHNLTFPFRDWLGRIMESWKDLATIPFDFQPWEITHWEWILFEFLALSSMTLQAAFLLLRWQWSNPLWVMGIGFALLFFCLSKENFVEQIAYTRTAFPITIAFNLLLLESKRGPLFFLYFIPGNIGLLVSLHEVIGFLIK